MTRFAGRDGAPLAYREIGGGRPLVLLHPLMMSGAALVDLGVAAAVGAGRRVVAVDLRGHGDSLRSPDPADHPPDVLADDGFALLAALGLGDGDYDLAGYSLGGIVVLRMLARGARPGRACVGGNGLDALAAGRGGRYHRLFTALAAGGPVAPADAEPARWAARLGADPAVLVHLVASTVPTPVERLHEVPTPTLVLIGAQDTRTGAAELAAALPHGRFARIPGTHFSALTDPAYGAAVHAFLGADHAAT